MGSGTPEEAEKRRGELVRRLFGLVMPRVDVFETGAGGGLFVPKPVAGHELLALHYLNRNAAKLPGWLIATLMAAAAVARFAAEGMRSSFRPVKSGRSVAIFGG